MNTCTTGLVSAFLLLALAGCNRPLNVDAHMKTAVEEEGRGELSTAIIKYKNILQRKSDFLPARLAMGRIYLKLGDTKAAITELDKVLQRDAENRDARVLRLRADLADGNFDRVIETLEKSPGNIDKATVSTIRGRAHLGRAEVEPAAALFRQALESEPTAVEAALGLAQIDLVTGQRESAGQKLAEVLAREPANTDALIERGKLELLNGTNEDAVKTYEAAVKLDPYRASAHLGLAMAQLANGNAGAAEKAAKRAGDLIPSSSAAAYLYAFAIYKQGREDDTLQILYNLMKVFPGHPQCSLLAAEILLRRGQVHHAVDILIPATTRHPNYMPTTIMLAHVQLRQGNASGVIERLSSIDKAGGATREIYSMLGSAYLQIKDFESASRALHKAAGFIDDPAQAKVFSAQAHLATGNPELAVDDLQQALAANPDLTQADSMLILAYLERKDIARALPLAESLVAKHPDSPQAFELLGRVHDAAGRMPEARANYEKTLGLDKTYVPAALRLAELDHQDGNTASVVARFDALLKEPLPNAGLSAVLLSKATLARGQNDKSGEESLLKRVLEKDPGNVNALLDLARIATQQGHGEEARRFLEQACTANPTAVKPRVILARHLIARNEVAGALDLAKQAYQLDRSNAEVLYTLGEAYRSAGKPDEAVKAYQQAVESGTDDVDVYLGYAAAAAELGDAATRDSAMKNALNAVHAAISGLGDKNLDATQLLALGRVELLRRDFQAAGQYVARLRQQFPDKPEGYELDGDRQVALDENNASVAARYYQKAIELGAGRTTIAKLAKLQLLTGTGDPRQLLGDWLTKHPDDDALRSRLIEAMLKAGDKPGSLAQMEILARNTPDNATVLNNLAALYHDLGDPRALDTAARAASLAPKSAAIKDTYGWILVFGNSLEQGLTLLRQAATELPDEPTVQFHYAYALAITGNRAEAVKTLGRVRQMNKDFPEKADAEKLARQFD